MYYVTKIYWKQHNEKYVKVWNDTFAIYSKYELIPNDVFHAIAMNSTLLNLEIIEDYN